MDSIMTVESALEFDTCFHFEYSPNITSFEAQPEGYYYNYLDKKLPYIPDFLVVDKVKGMRCIEVKPLSKVSDSEFREKFTCRQRDAQALGVPVVLVTEKQIRLNPILNNLKLLHRYAGLQSMTSLHYKILELVQSTGVISVRDLLSYTDAIEGDVLASTVTWLSVGKLKTDLSSSDLGLDSLVWC
jgi:hypothetical protein